jgi:hypothetical protein
MRELVSDREGPKRDRSQNVCGRRRKPEVRGSLEDATSRSAVAAVITTTLATSAGDIARKSLRSDRANADFPVTPSPPSG